MCLMLYVCQCIDCLAISSRKVQGIYVVAVAIAIGITIARRQSFMTQWNEVLPLWFCLITNLPLDVAPSTVPVPGFVPISEDSAECGTARRSKKAVSDQFLRT